MVMQDNQLAVVDNAAQILRADQARLNITWAGSNGDLPDPVPYDSTDVDLKQIASEAVAQGIPGIPADANVNFGDFKVDRFPAGVAGVDYNRLMIRPKTPFGLVG